ncbi:MAG TPA: hypothetical protein VG077_13100 [Verrucomicrobiae bacterium]|nr:hypothetical protein [Verrucomicrobiae bacterium]HEV2436930.1 hypothetical protein [Verrucomicrobiae bacterium]
MATNLKTYRISLACLIPHNFECEVQAENKLEAFNKGRNLFDEGKEGEIVEVLPAEPTLDLSDNDIEDEIPTGAHVEVISEE